MVYVLMRVSDRRCVTKLNSRFSYSYDIREIKFFNERDTADSERCVKNEVVVELPE